MSDKPIADARARELALDPTTSYICEAPAGSGKTELLTQRLLTLLARVEKPEEILAITFTRKAAGEMRDRVISALVKAKQAPKPESAHEILTWSLAKAVLEQDEKFQWGLISSPQRMQVLTFDSLCAALAKSLPFHSSFASPPQIAEDTEQLYRQAAQTFIQSLEEERAWSDAIAKVLSLLDNNTQRLENLLVSMLARREAWLPLLGRGAQTDTVIEELEFHLQEVRNDAVDVLKTIIPPDLLQTWIEHAGFAASNLRREQVESPIIHCVDMDLAPDVFPGADEKGVDQWLGMVTLLLTDKNDWRKSLTKRVGFPAATVASEKKLYQEKKQQCIALIESLKDCDGLLQALIDIRTLPKAIYDSDQRALLVAISEMLPILSAYLSLTFQENNNVDFSEVSLKALMALGNLSEPSELALALDYKLKHILVDEFQDTSPSQINLLTALTAGWELGDGRTMFCVGDAMQSIYAFRDANVGLFLQCLQSGLGHIPLTPIKLTTNFRSQEGVVSWINDVFSQAFPARSDISIGAVAYSHSVPFREKLDGDAVWVHGFSEDSALEDEARYILDIVRETRAQKPNDSIAILVRNRGHAAHITPLLKDAGFKYRAVDFEPLTDHVVIQDLMALTHALLRPADRIAWLSVLRAPWCGLSLVDLETIANVKKEEQARLSILQQVRMLAMDSDMNQGEARAGSGQNDFFMAADSGIKESGFSRLTEDGRLRLQRVLPVLQSICDNTQRKPLRQWIEGAWIALGGPACLNDEREFSNAELYFSLLEELDENTVLSSQDALSKAVQKLYALPDPDSDENLQIMTIHKSKGLEFDTVIVPSLQRPSRPQSAELLLWYERLSSEGEPHLLMSPITSSGREKDSVYVHLATQEKRRDQNEACRLLYVACTRAKKHLHLSGIVKRSKKKAEDIEGFGLSSPVKSSLLATIWQAVETKVKLRESEAQDEYKEIDNVIIEKPKYLRRLQTQWQMPPLDGGHLLDKFVPFFEHDNTLFSGVSQHDMTRRHVGTLVHRLLKDLNTDKLNQWQENIAEQDKKRWVNYLKRMGVAKDKLNLALSRTEAAIEGIVKNNEIHWLFQTHHPKRETEFAITMHRGDGIQHHVVDLFIDDGSSAWVIDYKTSFPEENEDKGAFISHELAAYRKVMLEYQRAVKNMGYNQVKLALYFPLLCEWHEYEV